MVVFFSDLRSLKIIFNSGRPDAEENAVSLITVHAAKGLEWPVVIPINMTGRPRAESGVIQDRRANIFSIQVLGIEPAGYPELWTWNDREDERERVRLWYVATTRARDILVLPRHSVKLPDKSWANIVDLGLNQLVRLDAAKLGKPTIPAPDRTANAQTRAIFTAEAGRIAQATQKVDWVRPSRIEIEADTPSSLTPLFESEDDAQQVAEIPAPSVAGSSQRGIILHKLMEEVLTGEPRPEWVTFTGARWSCWHSSHRTEERSEVRHLPGGACGNDRAYAEPSRNRAVARAACSGAYDLRARNKPGGRNPHLRHCRRCRTRLRKAG